MRMKAGFFLTVVTTLMTGCGDLPVGPPTIDLEAAQTRATLVGAQTTRERVHELLGEPWISSTDLGVEVYRAEGKQPYLGILLGVPMPTPSQKLLAYSLVAYGPDGRVIERDSDYGVNIGIGRDDYHESGSIPPKAGLLHAGNFQFDMYTVTLTVPLDVYLKQVAARGPGPGCTLLAGCDFSRRDPGQTATYCQCLPGVALAGGKSGGSTVWLYSVSRSARKTAQANCLKDGSAGERRCEFNAPQLYPFRLPTGHQVLYFPRMFGKKDVAGELDCEPGHVTYATFTGRFLSCGFVGSSRYDSGSDAVALTSDPVTARDTTRVIVNVDGKWLFPEGAALP